MPKKYISSVHGILPVYKPKNVISKDVSRLLAKRLGKIRMGHVGTLDPLAEGVLPILLGKATRLQDLLLAEPKTYEFGVQFGIETDTLDLEGQVVREVERKDIAAQEIQAGAEKFWGNIMQTPPLYSAVKYKGKALYAYGRAGQGESVPLSELQRQVFIYDFRLLEYKEGRAIFKVRCSKGTYVRVLAKDLANRLGTLGTVTFIKRTESAGIDMTQTVPLNILEREDVNIADYLMPVESLPIAHQSRWQCGDEVAERKLRMGQALTLASGAFGGRVGALTLFDTRGLVFGLGVAVKADNNYVQVQMKRELK